MHAYLAIDDNGELWVDIHRNDIKMNDLKKQFDSKDKTINHVPCNEVYETLHGQDAFLDQIMAHPWFKGTCRIMVNPLTQFNRFENYLDRTDRFVKLEAPDVGT